MSSFGGLGKRAPCDRFRLKYEQQITKMDAKNTSTAKHKVGDMIEHERLGSFPQNQSAYELRTDRYAGLVLGVGSHTLPVEVVTLMPLSFELWPNTVLIS